VDAESLMASVLGCSRSAIYLHRNDEIADPALSNFLAAVELRRKRVPLQYIVGNVEFYGLQLNVDGNVLIPRHETEELVDMVINTASADKIGTILDLGTGSGAIALTLGKHFPMANVVAVDVCPKALAVASKNAAKNGVENVTFLCSDWLDCVNGTFDVIISNPPYLSSEELEFANDEVRIFEPKLALLSENNGLGDIFKIISSVGRFLSKSGIVAMETGSTHHGKVLSFAKKYFSECKSLKDIGKLDRFVFLSQATE
jgi:release factor glutamine methyltransferase